jgi:hypothetical protein
VSRTTNNAEYSSVVPESQELFTLFTLKELWMLHDFIRHEIADYDKWKFPPASKTLNDKITEAIHNCILLGMQEHNLLLSKGDCYAIDYNIRRDAKTPEGAKGESILLKVFKTKEEIINPPPFNIYYPKDEDTYEKAVVRKEQDDASNSTSTHTNNSPNDYTIS